MFVQISNDNGKENLKSYFRNNFHPFVTLVSGHFAAGNTKSKWRQFKGHLNFLAPSFWISGEWRFWRFEQEHQNWRFNSRFHSKVSMIGWNLPVLRPTRCHGIHSIFFYITCTLSYIFIKIYIHWYTGSLCADLKFCANFVWFLSASANLTLIFFFIYHKVLRPKVSSYRISIGK